MARAYKGTNMKSHAPTSAERYVLPQFIIDKVERAIDDAKNPKGMHTNGPCRVQVEVSHLERLLFAARAAMQTAEPVLVERIAHLESEEEISEAVIGMMSRSLASIAITLKGEEAAMKRHSFHDLAELVQVMALELDLYKTIYGETVPEGWENGAAPDRAPSIAPTFDEAEFNKMVERGTKVWGGEPENIADVLRGRVASSDSAADAERLRFAMQDIDGFGELVMDKYDYAIQIAEQNGRDVPSADDELNGIRMLIDTAMSAIAALQPEGGKS